MRKIFPSLLIAASVSHAFQLPFNISSLWSQTPSFAPSSANIELPRSPRIAIIGAGASGSSAAFWIAKAKERYGLEVEVDIYERSDYIGGRKLLRSCEYPLICYAHCPKGSTTVYPYNDTAYEPVELGASIFVEVNKNLKRAVQEFNLSTYGFEDEDGSMGIWDGEQFLYKVQYDSRD
jgi:prenylcysteine oxidase / farnesylcysteine lyase